ncbi:MAG: alpha/beta hydrolase [Anaerolineaceae bacterium]|nr:alpha/beta hydrolase [Anaerolineaceae bacterium]
MQEIRVNTQGIELQVRDYGGEGDAIIFLHFSGANLMMWQRVVPYIQDQYSLILMDLRGHGKSDIPADGYHMDEMALDVIGVMDHLQIDKAHIIGSSLGAEVGLSMAANYPDRVISLILDGAMNSEYGPYGLWEGTADEFDQHVAAQLEKIHNAPEVNFPTLEAFMETRQTMYEKYDWWNPYVADMERYGARELADGSYTKGFGKQSNAAYMQNYFHYRFEDYYPKIKCPILMLMNKDLEEGREKEVLLGLRALAENAEIGEVSCWEHPYLWMLSPEEVCQVIKAWLNQMMD